MESHSVTAGCEEEHRDGFVRSVFAAFAGKVLDPGKREEDAWSAEVATHLRAVGLGCHAAVTQRYPSNGKLYDIFVQWADGETLFCESKGAWMSYWLDRGQGRKFRRYLFDPDAEYSAAKDLCKLETLTPATTTWVALIVFGSHRPEHDVGAVLDEFALAFRLRTSPWREDRQKFPNRWYASYSYNVRVWTCRRAGLAAWRAGLC